MSASGHSLLYDSAGERARQPVRGKVCDTSASSSEFEFGGATSEEHIPRKDSRRAPLTAHA